MKGQSIAHQLTVVVGAGGVAAALKFVVLEDGEMRPRSLDAKPPDMRRCS